MDKRPYLFLWENNLLLDSRVVFIFLGLFILIGIRLFWVSVKPERKKQIVVQEGALGKVRVAIPVIESLVEKTVAQNSGIREIKAQVTTVPQGIGIKNAGYRYPGHTDSRNIKGYSGKGKRKGIGSNRYYRSGSVYFN